LLSNGANLNIVGNDERTPLHLEADSGHEELTRELLRKSANVDTAVDEGWTPLHYAAESADVELTCELLSRALMWILQIIRVGHRCI
jgi:ankyrin repeat protein